MRRLMFLLLVFGLGCSDGEFAPLTLPTEAPLSGIVVDRAGEPVAGTTVYYVADARPMASVVTEADGVFVFEDAPTGRAAIVVHDGAGVGTYEDVTVYAGGNNYLGTVRVGPLRLEPRVLDIHGIGFEERISPTNDTIIAVDERGWALTVESLILKDPDCFSCDRYRFHRRSPQTDERIDAFGGKKVRDYLVEGEGITLFGEVWEVFALGSDEPLFSDSHGWTEFSPFHAAGMAIFELHDGQWVPFGVTPDGVRHEGEPVPNFRGGPVWLGVHDGRYYFIKAQNQFASIEIETGDYTENLVTFESSQMRSAALGSDEIFAIVWDRTDARIVSVSLSNGTRTDLHVEPCPDGSECLLGLARAEGAVSTIRTDPPAIIIVEDGAVTVHALDIEPGSATAVCFDDPFADCTLTSAFAGHVRIAGNDRATPGRRSFVDIVDGRVTRTLVGYGLDPNAFQVLSLDGATEIVSAIEPSTEFRQLHIGPIGSPLEDMHRLTHLHVDHLLGAVDPTLGHAVYTIDDPVHPGGALFRVGVD